MTLWRDRPTRWMGMDLPRNLRGLALSAGFALVLYWPAVAGLGFFFERDIWVYWLPHIEWATGTLANGRLPQWNPFVAFGSPFLADPSFQFFYPPSVLNWILPANVAYTVLVVGHTLFGSLGTFQLLRRRLRSVSSALVGVAVFIAAGPVVSSANLWHHFSSVMYMPWVLDAFLRLRSGRGGVKRLACLAALQALAGSADVCLMTGLGMALLLPTRWSRLWPFLLRLSTAVGLCLLLAAIQWLPTVILAGQTSRKNLDPAGRMHWSVTGVSLVDLVIPLGGIAHSPGGDPEDLEERQRLIQFMYMGASTLPLLMLGIRRAPRLGLLLALTIALSMGRHTPLAGLLADAPLISSFRFPSKILWFVSGCWAILAAIGCKDLTRRAPRTSLPGTLLGGTLVGLALTLWGASMAGAGDSLWERALGLAPLAPLALGSLLLVVSRAHRTDIWVALIVVLDLLGAGQAMNSYSSEEIFRIRPSLVDELRRQEASRIYVFHRSRSPTLAWKTPADWSEKEAFYFGLGQFLLPPQSVRWGLRGSFDGDFTGLARPEYSAMTAIASSALTTNEGWLRLAGVTHAIRYAGPVPAEFPVVASVSTFQERAVEVLKVPDPLPMAYVVHRVVSQESQEAALRTMGSSTFNREQEIVRIGAQTSSRWPQESAAAVSEAKIESDTGGSVLVRARLSGPGTLVLLNAYSEGWHASVDGKPRDVLPANLIFQSVDLEAGEHLVRLDYQTPGLMVGFWLSALAWGWIALSVRKAGGSPPRAREQSREGPLQLS